MEDFNEVGLNQSETEITSMKKELYQKNVKLKVRQAALQYLKESQQIHACHSIWKVHYSTAGISKHP